MSTTEAVITGVVTDAVVIGIERVVVGVQRVMPPDQVDLVILRLQTTNKCVHTETAIGKLKPDQVVKVLVTNLSDEARLLED